MQVKRYEAVDMNDAVKMIREDLGSEAVILSSRKVTKGKGAFGVFGRKIVEVTAASGETVSRRTPTPGNSRAPLLTKRNRSESIEGQVALMEPVVDGIEEIKERVLKLSQTNERPEGSADRIADDVRELKSMITYLVDRSGVEKEKGMPKTFLALARILHDRGLAPEYVEVLVDELMENENGNSKVSADTSTLLKASASRMAASLTFGGDILGSEKSAQNRIIAFVGPTGVGKTTTVAKLAAKLTMAGKKVALVTIDTYRIAAVEQLKTYAQILKIPLEVAVKPIDLARAIHHHAGKRTILIDTAGRSQRDFAQIDELQSFFAKSPYIEVQLALSSASSEDQMDEAVKNFTSKLEVSSLLFTKLDEAIKLGPVFNTSIRSGLPVSYFTTGQNVPDDIEKATAKKLITKLFKTN